MTQKVFDTDNAEDMALLWSILPDGTDKITRNDKIWDCIYVGDGTFRSLLKINWHDKTEITRPIQEATEQDIDKLCVFWDDDDELPHYGILDRIDGETYHLRINISPYTECYLHCRRLTKQEIEELC